MNDLINMKSIAKELNNRTFTDIFYRLMLVARSVFEWSGLEELGIDEKWIERYLFTEGKCLFFKDPKLGFMVARTNGNSPLNCYDEPTELLPHATNYVYNGPKLINNENCVLIRNNDEEIPTSSTIQLYSWRLASITRAIDVNVNAQKTPYFIRCSDKQLVTLRNTMKKIDENETTIYGDKSFEEDSIEVFRTDAPIVFDKLEYQKHMIMNECYTFLGVNNANQDKKERLVDDEVQANNEQVEVNFNMMLKAREEAAEKINKIFGTNVGVRKRAKNTPVSQDSKGSESDSKGGNNK